MEKKNEGIKIYDTFYVKPIMMNYFDEDSAYAGTERFLIVNYLLIQEGGFPLTVFNGYAYWKTEKLRKLYGTDNRKELLDLHFKNLPKDDFFFIEGVLTTTIPPELEKCTPVDIAGYIRDKREEAKRKDEKVDVQGLFSTEIMINDLHKKVKGARVITQRTLNIVSELMNTLPIGEENAEEGSTPLADALMEPDAAAKPKVELDENGSVPLPEFLQNPSSDAADEEAPDIDYVNDASSVPPVEPVQEENKTEESDGLEL